LLPGTDISGSRTYYLGLIDFEEAEISYSDSNQKNPSSLIVKGNVGTSNIRVSLIPNDNKDLPKYWKIFVAAYLEIPEIPNDPLRDFVRDAPKTYDDPRLLSLTKSSYSKEISLAGYLGTEGVEVVGANRSVKIAFKK
jgi:hypothetical protein